jgi:hypothetical protein
MKDKTFGWEESGYDGSTVLWSAEFKGSKTEGRRLNSQYECEIRHLTLLKHYVFHLQVRSILKKIEEDWFIDSLVKARKEGSMKTTFNSSEEHAPAPTTTATTTSIHCKHSRLHQHWWLTKHKSTISQCWRPTMIKRATRCLRIAIKHTNRIKERCKRTSPQDIMDPCINGSIGFNL